MEGLGHDQIHDFSGFLPLIRVGGISIPSYYFVISLTSCLLIVYVVARTKLYELRRNTALDLAVVVMISGFLGARLLHVVFEEPRYYYTDPIQILHIERGGFVWYGGAIGGIAAGLIFARIRQLPLAKWLDFSAPIIALGYACGRIACLLTGCCFGAICDLSQGFRFRYPTQIFAVIWELCVFVLLLRLEANCRKTIAHDRRQPSWYYEEGALFYFWLVCHGIGRMIMELFRADDRGASILGFSISTWISIAFVGVGLNRLAHLQRSMTRDWEGQNGDC